MPRVSTAAAMSCIAGKATRSRWNNRYASTFIKGFVYIYQK